MIRPSPGALMNTNRILTTAQIAEFEERGFIVLRHAFSSVVAARVRAAIWQKLGIDPQAPVSWPTPLAHIQDGAWSAPYSGAVTGRFTGALDDLVGAGRWKPMEHVGWWPVAFPVSSEATDGESVAEWRVGTEASHRRLLAADLGILPLFLFSDVATADGGALAVEGSHLAIAKALAAAEPAGLTQVALADVVRRLPKSRVTRVVGRAGDVVLMHPFMVHALSANLGQRVRFIAGPQVALRAALRMHGEDLSPVERAIARGIATRGAATVGAA